MYGKLTKFLLCPVLNGWEIALFSIMVGLVIKPGIYRVHNPNFNVSSVQGAWRYHSKHKFTTMRAHTAYWIFIKQTICMLWLCCSRVCPHCCSLLTLLSSCHIIYGFLLRLHRFSNFSSERTSFVLNTQIQSGLFYVISGPMLRTSGRDLSYPQNVPTIL